MDPQMESKPEMVRGKIVPTVEIIEESDSDKAEDECLTGRSGILSAMPTGIADDDNVDHVFINLDAKKGSKSIEGKPLYIDPLTAQRFSDLQAQLGYNDQPSKVLDWLMDAASHLQRQEGLTLPLIGRIDDQPLVRERELGRRQRLLTLTCVSTCVSEENSASNYSIEGKEDQSPTDWPQIEELPKDRMIVNQEGVTLPLLPGIESSTNNCNNEKGTHARWPMIRGIHRDRVKVRKSYPNYTQPSCPGDNACESFASNSTGFGVEKERLNCQLYCGIFPDGYEIDKDTLIQLWMAAGFVMNEPMEDVGAEYLQVLECEKFISISRCDGSSEKVWYKIHHSWSEDMSSGFSHVRLDAENLNPSPTTLGEPCHVTVQHSLADFEVLKKFAKMKTLLFLRGHGSYFKQVPSDFFVSLKELETLDLSGTRLLELPSSISNAKLLSYLDLSHTFIKQLPETIGHLQFLQTLKLKKCPRLIALL